MSIDERFIKVTAMRLSPEESEQFAQQNAIWLSTMDSHLNVLAYPENVMIEDLEDMCSQKYINPEEFFRYQPENGSYWIISNDMHADDMDSFFKVYLDMEAETA